MKKTPLLLLLLSITTSYAWALTAEEKGLQIAQKADRLDSGWGDQKQSMEMILRNKQGQESRRQIRGRSLEVIGDGDKALSIFDSPADVKGTAFLSFTHVNEPDDQWLYLPALKRVKRIASKNKSGPFMGSEFAFEDMSSQEVDKYTYKWLRDEQLDGKDVYVIERVPVDKHSGYTRQIVWGDREIYHPLKVEFYDRKNALLKTLVLFDYKQYLGKYWRPDRMEMTNHQNGKSTTLLFTDYVFNNGFSDRDFDRNSLKRAR
jgi:outer membrane lipoprotein-sorting protein